jgi:hypothetical protein
LSHTWAIGSTGFNPVSMGGRPVSMGRVLGINGNFSCN